MIDIIMIDIIMIDIIMIDIIMIDIMIDIIIRYCTTEIITVLVHVYFDMCLT